jgi:hypothetical protein
MMERKDRHENATHIIASETLMEKKKCRWSSPQEGFKRQGMLSGVGLCQLLGHKREYRTCGSTTKDPSQR